MNWKCKEKGLMLASCKKDSANKGHACLIIELLYPFAAALIELYCVNCLARGLTIRPQRRRCQFVKMLNSLDKKKTIKSNLSLYSLYYAAECNEFAAPTTTLLRPGNTASFEKISLRWQLAEATQCSISPARDLNIRLPTLEMNAFPLD